MLFRSGPSTNYNQYTYVPQTLNYDNDKDDLEAFMISMVIIDTDDSEDMVFEKQDMLNKINKLFLKKY